jgi:hypothetical protein
MLETTMVLCRATFESEQRFSAFAFAVRMLQYARLRESWLTNQKRCQSVGEIRSSFRGTAYQRHLNWLVAAPLSNRKAMPMYYAPAITVVPFEPP